MRPAGEVVRAAQGLAILRVDPPPDDGAGSSGGGDGRSDHPRIGTELVDGSLSTVGQVVDVFGPVERPYLAVTPRGRDPATMLGERLYVR